MKTIYISGPMSGIENLNREAFENAERLLRECGENPINPHNFPKQETYDDYLMIDLEMIAMAADAIALLPGWEKSHGAKKELKTAIELGLEIILMERL